MKLSGKVIKVTDRTANGTQLVSYIGDDDVGDNAQIVKIDDAGEVIKTKLEDATSLLFGGGTGNAANQITGTIDQQTITHVDGVTSISVEIPADKKSTTADCYTYHIKGLDDDNKGFVRIEGTIDLRNERASK